MGTVMAQADLQASFSPDTNLLGSVIDSAPNALFALNAHGEFVLGNQRLETLAERSIAELVHTPLAALIDPEVWQRAEIRILDLLREGLTIRGCDLILVRPSGSRRLVSLDMRPLWKEGKVIGAVGSIEDVSECRRASALIAGEKQVLELIAQGAEIAVILQRLVLLLEGQDPDLMVTAMLPSPQGTWLAHSARARLPEAYVHEFEARASDLTAPLFGMTHPAGYRLVSPDIATDSRWQSMRDLPLKYGLQACWSHPVMSSNSTVLGVFVTYCAQARRPEMHEVELMERAVQVAKIAIERANTEARLVYMARYDALTGLPNAGWCREQLAQMLTQERLAKGMVAVLVLDLDRFKLVNETLGHASGDTMLREVGRRMRESLRGADMVARLGGDEFIVVVEGLPRIADVRPVVDKITTALSKPMMINGQEVYTSASIGIAVAPWDGENVETLLKNADAAMYKVKEDGRDHHRFYHAEIGATTIQRLSLEAGLRHALERNEFLLHYQPKVDLSTGKVTGMEALLRWQHPERGLISPMEFIPVLEDTGLIMPVGEWVMQEACKQNRVWHKLGFADLRVAVNLSRRQFQQPDLVHRVMETIKNTGINPAELELEVTESMMMQNPERAVKILNELRALGVHISMDDFGTGYSSLGYLRRFPLGSVKIDRTFIRELPGNNDDAAIATAIIAMAHSLRLKVIAEGVEEASQVNFLRERACDEMQGFFFSKPLPTAAFEQMLREGRCMGVGHA